MNNKKKHILLVALAIMVTGLMSFTTDFSPSDYNVIVEKSTLKWKGYKVGGGHEGTVDIKSGSFTIVNDMVTSGSFVIDMPTMVPTDTKGSDTKKLTRHLRSEDFFNVQKYPEAKLVIKKAVSTGDKTFDVTGDMTILGKTNEIKFEGKILGTSENFAIATATIEIDRTKWGITYKSSAVGDMIISDDFDVKVKLFGKKR